MAHVFISYSHKDQEYALKITEELRRRGFEVWIDDDVQPGDRWDKEVVDNLTTSSALVVVMTPEANASEWVSREILVAQRQSKPIFPLLLRGEEFALLITTQYDDVRGNDLPSDRFFDRLGKIVALETNTDTKHDTANSAKQSGQVVTEQQRQADLRLVYELWAFISSRHIRDIVELVNQRNLEYAYYRRTFSKYLRLRETRPEKHFIDIRLEQAFAEFDVALSSFDVQLFTSSSPEYVRGTERIIPIYKLRGHVDQDTYHRLHGEHLKTLDLGMDVWRQHEELVRIIQLLLPEFTFPEEPLEPED